MPEVNKPAVSLIDAFLLPRSRESLETVHLGGFAFLRLCDQKQIKIKPSFANWASGQLCLRNQESDNTFRGDEAKWTLNDEVLIEMNRPTLQSASKHLDT